MSALPPPVMLSFLMFGLGAVSANAVWLRMAGIVRDEGFKVDYFFGRGAIIRNFKSLVQRQDDPVRRRSLQRLLTTWKVLNAWCLLWLAALAVTPFLT